MLTTFGRENGYEALDSYTETETKTNIVHI
jgi:hypothetical protein